VGVVLAIALELDGVFAKKLLEKVGSAALTVHVPHFVNELSVSQSQTAISSQGVFNFGISERLVVLV